MPNEYLDFEEPIAALENKIQDLQSSGESDHNNLSKEILQLQTESNKNEFKLSKLSERDRDSIK